MIQEFMAAAQSVKVLNDIVQGSLELKKFNDLALAISKANESLLSAQTAAMKAQAEQSALAEKIRQLEQKIMNMENWEAQKQNYRLQSVSLSIILCKWFSSISEVRHSVFKHDAELIQCSLPVLYRHRPFLRYILQGQVEQLEHGLVIGKRSPVFGHFAQ